jgi:hypothetical protein
MKFDQRFDKKTDGLFQCQTSEIDEVRLLFLVDSFRIFNLPKLDEA